jgi:hypothetical protein
MKNKKNDNKTNNKSTNNNCNNKDGSIGPLLIKKNYNETNNNLINNKVYYYLSKNNKDGSMDPSKIVIRSPGQVTHQRIKIS